MLLTDWAIRWRVPLDALVELRQAMGVGPEPPTGPQPKGSEAKAQQDIRVAAPWEGVRLWRNNVGVAFDARGVPVRFGLCNDSKAVNTVIKSGDLIGITPTIVRPIDVGQTWGVFTSVEVKRPGWVFQGTDRERGQLKWNELIISLGGKAQFATCPGDIWR